MVEKCFISYSHRDYPFVNLLHAWLEHYPDQVQTWRDTRLSGGNEWRPEINYQIDQATVFIAVASTPFFQESKFCIDELKLFAERMQHQPGLRIIPIKIDDLELKEDENYNLPVSKYQWVDFRQWLTAGDKIFRETLLPAITSQPAVSYSQPESSHLFHSSNECNSLKEIVIDFCSKTPKDAKAQHLITLVVSYIQNNSVALMDKAVLATELGTLHIHRGEWSLALKCNVTSLELIEKQGVDESNINGLLDSQKILIGRNLGAMGLISRQLKNGRCEQYLNEALAALESIRDPLLSDDHCAQIHRELCTFFMSKGEFDKAQSHAVKSSELLSIIPSQYYHNIQAKNKQAQIALLQREFARAELILKEIWPLFVDKQFLQPNSMIVYCQVLVTKIFLAIVQKLPSKQIKELLTEHSQVSNSFGLKREKKKNLILRLLTPFRHILPFWVLKIGLMRFFRGG